MHCAHGYLLSRFLDPSLNFRDDSFGRGLKGRLRFPVMCIRAIRHHCGAGFPIMIKINTDTEKAEHSQSYIYELPEILECFYEEGVVLAELSGTDFRQRPHYEHNYYIEAASLLNAETHMPFAIVGGTRSLTDMWEAFSAGATMVSMSRPLIREPDFPNSLRLGRKSIPPARAAICALHCRAQRGYGASAKINGDSTHIFMNICSHLGGLLMRHFIVNIGREFGALGLAIGKKLAGELGVKYYDRELVEAAAMKSHITAGKGSIMDENPTPQRRFCGRPVLPKQINTTSL